MDVLSKFGEQFLVAFAPVLASLAAGLLFAWIKKVWAEFKSEAPSLAYYLDMAATMAVQAAEQAKLAGLIEDKKTYAIGVAEKYLAAKGITADLDLIAAAIEAAVWTELNKAKEKDQ